jgi:chromosome segregation ATPase
MTYRACFPLLFVTAAALAQTAPPNGTPDTRALQALVTEIHQLRLDLQSTTVAAQRVQIALFRLQVQNAAVARATSRLDDVRSNLAAQMSTQRRFSSQLQQVEEKQRSTQDLKERKGAEELVPQIKAELERVTADVQRYQASEAEAETQLRVEQAKLGELQNLIDRLDKLLESFGRQ